MELKPLGAIRLHEVTETALGFGPANISPVIGPLYDRLFPALERAGVPPHDPSVIYFTGEGAEMESDAGEVNVHVGMPATDDEPWVISRMSRWLRCQSRQRSCTTGVWRGSATRG